MAGRNSGCGCLGVRGQVCGGPVPGETWSFPFCPYVVLVTVMMTIITPLIAPGSRDNPEMPTGQVAVSLRYRRGTET